jgi:hypothetical protein
LKDEIVCGHHKNEKLRICLLIIFQFAKNVHTNDNKLLQQMVENQKCPVPK